MEYTVLYLVVINRACGIGIAELFAGRHEHKMKILSENFSGFFFS